MDFFGLYIHIPFCRKKCPYCHFYVIHNTKRHQKIYLETLKKEWESKKNQITSPITSIYFGGGTPSLFPEAAEKFLGWVRRDVLTLDPEITFEANPEDISPHLLDQLALSGINRISLGVQSFDEEELLTLGRTKKRPLIEEIAKRFTNISIDLMYDIPHQSVRSFERTLTRALDLPITHFSLYNLTIEPHTVFYKTKPSQPSEKESLKMLELAINMAEKKGFHRYEISAFARKGYEARHNTLYWKGYPFLGFGPSAFSYMNGSRLRNYAHILRYAKALKEKREPFDFSETLPFEKRQKELLAIELRLLKGVDLTLFQKRHGKVHASLQQSIEKLLDLGLLIQDKTLKLSHKGRLFYDTAMSYLI